MLRQPGPQQPQDDDVAAAAEQGLRFVKNAPIDLQIIAQHQDARAETIGRVAHRPGSAVPLGRARKGVTGVTAFRYDRLP